LPAHRTSAAARAWVGIPKPFAKSLPLPQGMIPKGISLRAIPFKT